MASLGYNELKAYLKYLPWSARPIVKLHIDGLVQDCGNSSADALELPQPYAKP